jgi:hypothetical protein
MQTELGIVITADWPACVVRKLGSGEEPVDAVESAAMQENYIRVRTGDLVRVDFTARPAEVVRRHGWRATVTGVDGTSVTFSSLPNGRDGTAIVPAELGLTLGIGDAVLVRGSQRLVVVDVLEGDEPAHPAWFEAST